MDDIVSGDHVRWLTYAEAGRLLGTKDDSIRRRAMRVGWKRRQGNDGRALVAVPLDVLADVSGDKSDPDKGLDIRGDIAGNRLSDLREALARREAEVEALRGLVARLEADKATMAAEAQEARQTADKRAVELAEVRERAGRAEAEREAADRRAQELSAQRDQAAHQVEAVRAELAVWREGGPIARAVRAFLYRKLS
jgi:DNA repair exonuclease SbcCD ATPase subunit